MKHFSAQKLAIATSIALGAMLATTAHADPKISGRLYLSTLYENKDVTETNTVTNAVSKTNTGRTTLNSGGSRIRFTGDEKLTDDVTLDYRLEYSVFLDNDAVTSDGKSLNFAARTTYLGLKHKDYGHLAAGRMYTPDDDIDYVNAGYLYASGAEAPFSYHGQRTNNTFQYTSPKINDKTQFKLHYAMDEDIGAYVSGSNNHGGAVSGVFVNGKQTTIRRDLIAGHVLHEDEKFDAGLAYTYAGEFKALRGMVWLKPTDKFKYGIIAQQTDYNSGNKELGALITGYYSMDDKTDFYAQAGYADNFKGFKDGERTVASTGIIKWLKRDGGTRVRAFGTLNYDDRTEFKYTNDQLIKVQSDAFGVEAGLRYDFW